MNKHPNKSSGFGIIEALVALVILSVGMLGIASLYITTMKSNGSAKYRTQAVNLAADMADRIRANRYAGAGAANAYAGSAATVIGCVSSTCTAAQIAANDLYIWNRQIGSYLPAGATGTIGVAENATPPINNYTITISWAETDSVTLSYVLRLQI